MSIPESRPPRLTDAERRQLDELERRLIGQFPDLDSRFGAGVTGPPLGRELRIVRAVFAALALAMIVVGAAVGGPGGALAVLLSVGGTAALIVLATRLVARARATVEAAVQKPADTTG